MMPFFTGVKLSKILKNEKYLEVFQILIPQNVTKVAFFN